MWVCLWVNVGVCLWVNVGMSCVSVDECASDPCLWVIMCELCMCLGVNVCG